MFQKRYQIALSLLFAMGLWLTVAFSGEYFANLELPIKVINLPKGYAVSSQSIEKATLSLKGEGWKLAVLNMKSSKEYYVSALYDSVNRSVKLLESFGENNWIFSGVQVIDIKPDGISFSVEKIITRKLKVIPKAEISFSPGFYPTSDLTIIPESVYVSGPFSIVNSMNFAYTEEIKIANIEGIANTEIPLERLKETVYEQNHVVAQISSQRVADKPFSGVRVETVNVPYGRELSLYPDEINIVLRGGINILAQLKKEDIKAFIEYSSAELDSIGSLEPIIETPKFIELVDKKPQRLKYIIKRH